MKEDNEKMIKDNETLLKQNSEELKKQIREDIEKMDKKMDSNNETLKLMTM